MRPEDMERLHAFRRAAADVHAASIMRAGGSVGFRLSVRADGEEKVTPNVYDQERFKAFAIAIRRVYGRGLGHFPTTLTSGFILDESNGLKLDTP